MCEITVNNRIFFWRVIASNSPKTNSSENEVTTFYIFALPEVWSYGLAMRDLLNNSRDSAGVASYYQIKGAIQSSHLKLRIK